MIKPAGTSFEEPFEEFEDFSLDEFETSYETGCDETLCDEFRSECDAFFAPGGVLESSAENAGLK